MNREERIKKRDAVLTANTFEDEQEALKHACIVDILPSLPKGVADLYHQWNHKNEPETTTDYVKTCRSVGANYDRGAQRYFISAEKAKTVANALENNGFVVALHPSLLKK